MTVAEPVEVDTSRPPAGLTREALVELRPRVVHLSSDITGLDVWMTNLQAVTAALDSAGVDYFVVKGTNDRRPVVGVEEASRAQAGQALRRACERDVGYVCQIEPRPPVRDALLAGDAKKTWARLSAASVIRLVWFRADPSCSLIYGTEFGCDIEFWRRDDSTGRLIAPRRNRVALTIMADSPAVTAPASCATRLASRDRAVGPAVRTRSDFVRALPEDITFPIDVVYTWVDGSDPDWRRRRAEAEGQGYHPEAASDARFINRDELRYSLRSLHLNAPWVRNIYLVTDDQTPAWLDTSRPNLQVVSHKEIFSDPSVLPVFNSFSIESQLHHIEGLAEHFLYLNDDMFFGRPVTPQAFFLGNGVSKYFPSETRVPFGPVQPTDTPIEATVKNNRALIESRFGFAITQCSKHVPYALQRTVLHEIEKAFPEQYRATMASRFRSPDNLSVTYSLHHYYALGIGRAVPGSVRYGYIQLAVPDLAERLDRVLARRDWDTFCLNDAYSSEEDILLQNRVLQPFLEAYFPVPSPYEKTGAEESGAG